MNMQEPAAVEAGAHRLSIGEAVSHSTGPIAHHALLGILLITVVVVIVVVVDLIRGGRFRRTALALTRMLSLLAPLVGMFGAAIQIAGDAVIVANDNIANPAVWAPSVLAAAWIIAISAVCGGIGVILTAVLRIAGPGRKARLGD